MLKSYNPFQWCFILIKSFELLAAYPWEVVPCNGISVHVAHVNNGFTIGIMNWIKTLAIIAGCNWESWHPFLRWWTTLSQNSWQILLRQEIYLVPRAWIWLPEMEQRKNIIIWSDIKSKCQTSDPKYAFFSVVSLQKECENTYNRLSTL